MNRFLELNPEIPRDQAFVDDYTFSSYAAAGLGSLENVDKENIDFKLEAPEIGGFKQWLQYFMNFNYLAPIPENMKFGEIPKGVLQLGGTFVIDGEDVIYEWIDKIPGDVPDVAEVAEIAGKGAPKQPPAVVGAAMV